MSVIGSNILAGASGQGGGYNLTNSLRFRRSATAYLNRTPASAGNRQIWTWSAWVKRGDISANYSRLFSVSSGNSGIQLQNDYTIRMYSQSPAVSVATSAVLRDPSAWYHIVIALDTTQATSTNRVKIYINGVLQTVSGTYPSQNDSLGINNNVVNYLGSYDGSSEFFDGYMTEINFIDGQALTPSSFGETSTSTGVWQPKKFSGTYGTNGFYLPFTNTSSTSTLGNDFSGNSNTWTVNNISLTAGTTYDSMTDVPTLTSATAANYCVMNPLINGSSLINGNLKQNTSAPINFATIGQSSGKWYWEVTITTQSTAAQKIGIANSTATGELGDTATGWAMIVQTNANGQSINNGSLSSSYTTFAQGDILNIAVDVGGGKVWWGKNGTWLNSGVPASGTGAIYTNVSGTIFPAASNIDKGVGSGVLDYNFGQQPFSYTPPTGFVALNTFNLPTPTIGATASTQANKYFDATTYAGTGGQPQTITNAGGFQPDFIWIKNRSTGGYGHSLQDVVRGFTTGKKLRTDQTSAEGDATYSPDTSGYVSAVQSNGFQLTYASGGDARQTHNSNDTYVGWQWKANGSGVTNTAGSITSTVSANTSAGFSVVTYTGTGVTGTLGHGLGVAPAMIIVKSRSNASNWYTYHQSIGNTGAVALNLTDATITSANFWNNTSPTSTVFTASAGSSEINGNGLTYVAYCFAEVAGYSKFGSYTGNGSTDGTFVYLGFRPKFVLLKRTDVSGDWVLIDSVRGTYNTNTPYVNPNNSNAENGLTGYWDLLSNGFKVTTTDTNWNNNGSTYIYMAFAETPLKFSNAR